MSRARRKRQSASAAAAAAAAEASAFERPTGSGPSGDPSGVDRPESTIPGGDPAELAAVPASGPDRAGVRAAAPAFLSADLSAAPAVDASPQLSPRAAQFARSALAPATIEKYAAELRRLDAWLAESGRPADDSSIADYLLDRHEAGLAPPSAALTVAAVRCATRLSGRPELIGAGTFRVLKAIRREGRGRGRGQVLGLQWDGADRVADITAEGGRRGDLRNAAFVALMSDCLLRISEACAVQVGDLETVQGGAGAGKGRLTIPRSKTDQEGVGAVVPVRRATMRRIAAWRQAAGIAEGPLFRRLTKGGQVGDVAIGVRRARDIIRARAAAAELDGRFSGHSFRVGSAMSLAEKGAGLVEMQTAGRWRDPKMPGHYARGQLADRGAVARLRPDDD